jgi:hypothetical protein
MHEEHFFTVCALHNQKYAKELMMKKVGTHPEWGRGIRFAFFVNV